MTRVSCESCRRPSHRIYWLRLLLTEATATLFAWISIASVPPHVLPVFFRSFNNPLFTLTISTIFEVISWPYWVACIFKPPLGVKKVTFFMTTTEVLAEMTRVLAAIYILAAFKRAGEPASPFATFSLWFSFATLVVMLRLFWIPQLCVFILPKGSVSGDPLERNWSTCVCCYWVILPTTSCGGHVACIERKRDITCYRHLKHIISWVFTPLLLLYFYFLVRLTGNLTAACLCETPDLSLLII